MTQRKSLTLCVLGPRESGTVISSLRNLGALYLEQLAPWKDLWLHTCGSEEVYTNKLPFILLPSSS